MEQHVEVDEQGVGNIGNDRALSPENVIEAPLESARESDEDRSQ